VNTASRLQGVAPAGGVVAGEMTYRSTRHVVDYERLEPVQVKGKIEPVSIWRALRPKSRYAVEIERAPTPFIGREDDLALLQQTFRRMLREPSVQLVTVTGEPGVGKSRLTAEFSSWVDALPERVSWRQGRCLPYGEGITFWALGEIVKAQAEILESDAPDEAGRKLSEAVGAVVKEDSEREWLSARLAPLLGLPAPQVDRDESFAAWRTFLEAAASIGPLILQVEDVNWADDAMLDFIEHVVDWSTQTPILVLCTARPELFERRPGWGGGKHNSTTIALSPLTDQETARLIATLLAEAVLPAETQAALLDRSGGNPLYAEEFVQMLTDRKIIERRGRTVRIAEDAEIPVPETVQGLIAARLDTLPADRKALLQDAAVVGRVFWSGAVAKMGARDQRAVGEDLHELARKELVRPVRNSSMESQAEYTFWHILVQDVAYGQIPRVARVAKHRAAAEWIEGMAGERVADHAELLAHHYTQALGLARAAGETSEVGLLEERTCRFLIMAGERAMGLDVVKAESYLRSALELLPDDHPDRPRILTSLGDAVWQQGRFSDATQAYGEAIAGFERLGDPLGAGEAKVRLQDVLQIHGETVRATNLLAEAARTLEGLPPGRALASAYVMLARRRTFEGRERESLQYAERALALAREIGARQHIVRAMQFVGFARCSLGDLGGLDDLREALRLGLEWGLGIETGLGYTNLGDWVWQAEGPAPGLEVYQEGVAFTERRGLREVRMWLMASTAWPLFELGRWDEVLEVAEEVAAWERPKGGRQLRGITLPDKVRVLLFRGRLDEAAAVTEELLPLARSIHDLQVLLPSLITAALVERARGNLDSATQMVQEWLEARSGTNWASGANIHDAIDLLSSVGASDQAGALLDSFAPRCAREDHSRATGWAILAEAAGDVGEGAKLFAEAGNGWQGYGNVVDHGRSLLGTGRCLVGLGQLREAAERLRDARATFVALGAGPFVAEADAWLEQATAVSS
jgi:tetratricopeptide (TPR) repeat protein